MRAGARWPGARPVGDGTFRLEVPAVRGERAGTPGCHLMRRRTRCLPGRPAASTTPLRLRGRGGVLARTTACGEPSTGTSGTVTARRAGRSGTRVRGTLGYAQFAPYGRWARSAASIAGGRLAIVSAATDLRRSSHGGRAMGAIEVSSCRSHDPDDQRDPGGRSPRPAAGAAL